MSFSFCLVEIYRISKMTSVYGRKALAGYQGARSPLAESEAAPQVDPAKPQRKNPQRSCGASPGVSDAANAAERPKGLLRCNPG